MPPRRSMRTMRRICRKRMLRSAEVAKMFPCVPAAMTASDATNTMKSAGGEGGVREVKGSWSQVEQGSRVVYRQQRTDR